MNILPLEDRVVITPLDDETDKHRRIIIPETAKDKPTKGKVLRIGPGRIDAGQTIAMTVKVNDIVLYNKYAGIDFEIDGQEIMILRQSDIVAILQ